MLLPTSVTSLYCTYLCYTGLARKLREYIEYCNGIIAGGQNDDGKRKTYIYRWDGIFGMATINLSLVYPAVSVGSNSSKLTFEFARDESISSKTSLCLYAFDHEKQKDERRPTSYSYSLFHLIFAVANMYSMMILIGWKITTTFTSIIKSNDVGWPSLSVHISLELITTTLYI